MKYKRIYETTRGIDHRKNINEHDGGYCKKGHYNIIPACTEMKAGNKLKCVMSYHIERCDEIIWECIKVRVYEEEI